MPKVNSHPVSGVRDFGIRGADFAGCGFVLGFPKKRVVVAPMPEVQEATRGHLEVQRGVERPPRRDRQQRLWIRPHAQFFHGRDQSQPVGDVVVAQTTRPVFNVGLEMEHGVTELVMPGARDLAQVLDEVLALSGNQAGNGLFAEPRK